MTIRQTRSFSLVLGLIMCALMGTFTAKQAHAATTVTSFADIEYWVGTGSNQTAMVLDFNDGADALVWGYRWDTPPDHSTKDMLNAVNAADANLNIAMTTYGTASFVDSISYGTRSAAGDINTSTSLFYYFGSSYDSMSTTFDGVSDHVLIDGQWNALALRTYDVNNNYEMIDEPFSNFSAVPVPSATHAVPEPATASMLAMGVLGGVAVIGRRRRSVA